MVEKGYLWWMGCWVKGVGVCVILWLLLKWKKWVGVEENILMRIRGNIMVKGVIFGWRCLVEIVFEFCFGMWVVLSKVIFWI